MNLVFPDFCLGCYRIGSVVCEDCLCQLRFCDQNFCSEDEVLFDRLYYCYDFDKEHLIRRLVHQFKYRFCVKVGQVLGDLMVEFWKECASGEYLIVPMPVSESSFRERGFNQSYILARSVSSKYGYDLIDCLCHCRDHENQMKLSREERLKNLDGAISVRDEVRWFIAGKRILLVDDIATTGASLNECSKVLKMSGAGKIDCLVLARAGMS